MTAKEASIRRRMPLRPRTAAASLVAVASGLAIWSAALARATGSGEVTAVSASVLAVALGLVGVFERSTAMALAGVMVGSVLLGMLSAVCPHLPGFVAPVPAGADFPLDIPACRAALGAGARVGAGVGAALVIALAVLRASRRRSLAFSDEALCGRGALWSALLTGAAAAVGATGLAHAAAALSAVLLLLPLRSGLEGRRWLAKLYAGLAQGYELKAPADPEQLERLPLLTPRARATDADLVLWRTGSDDPYRSRHRARPIARVAPELACELAPVRTSVGLCWASGLIVLVGLGVALA